jgi:folate-binding protein YgfZ
MAPDSDDFKIAPGKRSAARGSLDAAAAASHRAAPRSAVLFRRSDRGLLRLTGGDALDLLHRTTTADLARLPVGGAAPTVVQTETARVVDWLTVIRRADDIVLVGGPGRGDELAAWIDRLVIMEDVQVETLGAGVDLFEVAGPGAAAAVAEAFDDAAGALRTGQVLESARVPGVTIVRGFELRPDAHLLLFDSSADRAPLEKWLASSAVTVADASTDEALRIAEGRPLVGRELNGDANPLEARLETSVSFTKGCYPGQEVVARLVTYKSLKRRLALFELDRDVPSPAPGTNYPAVDGGAPAARITSVARACDRTATIALGYAKNELAAPGTDLLFSAADGPVRGRVLDFPPAP